MFRPVAWSALAALLLVAVATVVAPARAALPAAAERGRQILLAADETFASEVAAKGFGEFDRFFADDAVYLPTNQPMVLGKAAIMESFRPLIGDPKVRLTWKPLHADVAASGELGWTYGTYEFRAVDAAGREITRHGKYVTIWRRQADGAWKAVLDGGSPDEAPKPAAG